MGTTTFRLGLVAAWLVVACPAIAAEDVDNGSFAAIAEPDNAIVPPPSEEALIFTGRDERPLTPSKNGFSEGVDSVVSGAKVFSTLMGPETWAILIGGFALVGFAVRRSERVLRFEPRRDAEETSSRRTVHPERSQAGSGRDVSIPPRSGSDPAPSAPPAPIE